jgi:hypothetical protein
MEYNIYTDKPLYTQIDMDELARTFGTVGNQSRVIAYITHKYEQATNRGKAYITVKYTHVQFKDTRRMKAVVQISDTDAQVKPPRIHQTHVCHTRNRINTRTLEDAIHTNTKDKRELMLSVRLTHEEHEYIKQIASNTHSTMSKVIHTLIQECMK